MAPHRAEAEKQKAIAVEQKERLVALRKQKSDDDTAMTACRDAMPAAEKAARDATAKAETVDAACFDPKAVNPNAKTVTDTRTPAEIIASIETHGKTVDDVLVRLKKLL